MKKIVTTLISITAIFFLVQPVMAVTATPSATPTQNMADQVKTLVKENLATTEAKLKEKVDLQSLVGYVGKITTISSSNLTIDSHNNLLQITTNTKTAFLKDGSNIKITSLAINDKVIIIGTSVKDGIISAKRVSVIKDEPVLVKTSAIVSKVIFIDPKKKTLTLSINGSDKVLTLSKKSTVKLEDLKIDQTILAIVKEFDGKLSISRAKVL